MSSPGDHARGPHWETSHCREKWAVVPTGLMALSEASMECLSRWLQAPATNPSQVDYNGNDVYLKNCNFPCFIMELQDLGPKACEGHLVWLWTKAGSLLCCFKGCKRNTVISLHSAVCMDWMSLSHWISFNTVVLNLCVKTTLGSNDPFIGVACLRPLEYTGIYIVINNSSKLTVMK